MQHLISRKRSCIKVHFVYLQIVVKFLRTTWSDIFSCEILFAIDHVILFCIENMMSNVNLSINVKPLNLMK